MTGKHPSFKHPHFQSGHYPRKKKKKINSLSLIFSIRPLPAKKSRHDRGKGPLGHDCEF